MAIDFQPIAKKVLASRYQPVVSDREDSNIIYTISSLQFISKNLSRQAGWLGSSNLYDEVKLCVMGANKQKIIGRLGSSNRSEALPRAIR